mgnify:CR=1 FL=1
MFNLDTFIENCKSAVASDDTHLGIKDLVGKAVSEPGSLMKAIGEPSKAGARSLSLGDVTPLGPDIIHSVNNPIPRNSGAIHIYGGDFFHVENRSEWDPEDLTEHEYDAQNVKNVLENFSVS